jgi:hypothetical protein
MTSAAYQKARRDRCRLAGICLVCTKLPALVGRSTCEHCHELKRGWNKAYAPTAKARVEQRRREEQFHLCCQAVGFHRVDCREQRAA